MKLLVNTPSGKQELISIGEGGGYFDASRVLWDTRTDGALPVITLGGMVRVDDALVFDQARMDDHAAASAPPIPQSVSPRQLRQALSRAALRAPVETAVAAADQDTKDWYQWATSFERQHPRVIAMGVAMGQTTQQLDALFTLAGTL